MSVNVISAKLSGKSDANFWSQTYQASPDDQSLLKEKGKLFATISVHSNSGIDLAHPTSFELGVNNWTMAKVIFERLSEEYFKNTSPTLVSLKNAHHLVRKNFSSLWNNLEIALLVVKDSEVYCCASGGSGIAILREGSLTNILNPGGQQTLSASGKSKLGDIFLIGSNAFFNNFNYQEMVNALSLGNLQTSAQNLASSEKFEKNQSAAACLFVKFITSPEEEKIIINQTVKPKKGLKIPDLKNKLVGIIKLPFGKKLYLREEHDPKIKKRRKVLVSVGSILILLLGVSIVFGMRQAKIKEIKTEYEESLNQAEHELSEAENIYPLSKERSRELFVESKKKGRRVAQSGS